MWATMVDVLWATMPRPVGVVVAEVPGAACATTALRPRRGRSLLYITGCCSWGPTDQASGRRARKRETDAGVLGDVERA